MLEAGRESGLEKVVFASTGGAIYGPGTQTLDYDCVTDVVHAKIAGLGHESSGTFNAGTGGNALFREIYRFTGKTSSEIHRPAKPDEEQRSVLDASRIQESLGWKPQVALEERLARTDEWFWILSV